MSTFNTAFQPLFDHAQTQASLWLDTTRKNLDAGLDLAERAVSVRNLDDAKSLIEASAQTTRANFERALQASQQSIQEATTLVKTSTERARAQVGTGLPNLETLLDPKTYGFAGVAEATRSTGKKR